jgi:hypothetical protein
MMVGWNKRLFKIALWLLAEVTFNLLGVDEMMDCSEFLFGREMLIQSQPAYALVFGINDRPRNLFMMSLSSISVK